MKKETIAFVLPSRFPNSGGGWGCGYVALPEGHPFFGLKEDWDGNGLPDGLEASGGITFASLIDNPKESNPFREYLGMWVLGFDTDHIWDSPERWPDAESVMAEALKLKAQCDDKDFLFDFLQSKIKIHQEAIANYNQQIIQLLAD